jgi:hypothetical protein
MEVETEPEPEAISLEECLASLKRNAKAVEVHLQEAVKKTKSVQRCVAQESKKLCDVPLQPRTRMLKWLSDRNLKSDTSFADFFETLVQEHKVEHRLSLSERSFTLNADACVLFGIKGKDPRINLYDLIEKFHTLYY